ncbi:hypothetical protein [Vibrio cholerae]|uniref:hypothetical protein n=1 Tax=Vibrio cholerae TaxID=666 RepID=UPI0016431D7A|nr:hypothetical protein [Vibrio cholerae]
MKELTHRFIGMLSLAATALPMTSFAAHQGTLTLPSKHILKDNNVNPLGYFKSDVLRTSQENIATGVHDFEIRVPDDAPFSIKADSKVIRNVGELQTNNRILDLSETRTITVSVSGWSNSGGVYSCSGWSPSPSTVASGTGFTQTRICSQIQIRGITCKN